MKLCIISTIPCLKEFATLSNWHLILAHLCENKQYFSFYFKRAKKGDYVILDNSWYELGHSLELHTLIDIANKIGACELVVPELDNVSTQEYISYIQSILLETKSKFAGKIHVVLKGQSFSDYVECFVGLNNIEGVDVIGIPVGMGRRDEFFKYLQKELRKRKIKIQKEIHLLGLRYPRELVFFRKIARSVDTSIAVWSGIWGMRIFEFGFCYDKLPAPVDFSVGVKHSVQRRFILENIKTLMYLGDVK